MSILGYFENLEEARAAWEEEWDLIYMNDYPAVLTDVKDCGFSTVYDIGSSFGPHVEYALENGFKYIGVDRDESPLYWEFREHLMDFKGINAEFMFGKEVPFSGFSPEKDSCAISICALGSLYCADDDIIRKHMEFVTAYFKHFWCSTFDESLEKMSQYWQHSETLRIYPRKIVHFWND